MRLLLVEDARLIREPLSRALELTAWEVEAVPDGEAALARLAVAPVDAVVLDIMLPGKDGLSVLSELRARGDATPVILLTARGDMRDRVRGLDLGADDYLAKPFHVEELLARLRAVLRRRGGADPSTVIEALGMFYAPDSRELTYGEGSCVLTPKEGLVLEALMRHAGTPVHRERIMASAWGADGGSSAGRIETQVSLLRSKIAALIALCTAACMALLATPLIDADMTARRHMLEEFSNQPFDIDRTAADSEADGTSGLVVTGPDISWCRVAVDESGEAGAVECGGAAAVDRLSESVATQLVSLRDEVGSQPFSFDGRKWIGLWQPLGAQNGAVTVSNGSVAAVETAPSGIRVYTFLDVTPHGDYAASLILRCIASGAVIVLCATAVAAFATTRSLRPVMEARKRERGVRPFRLPRAYNPFDGNHERLRRA